MLYPISAIYILYFTYLFYLIFFTISSIKKNNFNIIIFIIQWKSITCIRNIEVTGKMSNPEIIYLFSDWQIKTNCFVFWYWIFVIFAF